MGVLLKLRQVGDGLRNLVSAVGTPKDKTTGWNYNYVPLGTDQIEAMYASSWLARKIVDVVAQDMTREWRTWQIDSAEDIYRLERKLKLRRKVKKAIILGRLYGGGAILMGNGDENPEEPMDVSDIQKDGLEYVHVFSRHDLAPEGFVGDIADEHYGRPEFYRISAGSSWDQVTRKEASVRIHRSRFVLFTGQEWPSLMFSRDLGEWGIPIYDSIVQAILNAEATPANAAALTEEAKVDVVKIPDLMSYLSDQESTTRLIERFSIANTLKSTVNMLILGGEETFERKQVSLAGYTELIQIHLQIAAGAADVPVTRLLGQSPAGMNATGESDLTNYYDKIRGHQQTDLIDEIERLDEALVRSATGDYPDEATYEWNPLWQMDQMQKSTVFKTKMDGVSVLNTLNLLAPEELRPAVFDMLIDDGTLGTIGQYRMPDDEAAAVIAGPQPGAEGAPAEGAAPALPDDGLPPDQEIGGASLRVVQGGRTDSWAEDGGLGGEKSSSDDEAAGSRSVEDADQESPVLA